MFGDWISYNRIMPYVEITGWNRYDGALKAAAHILLKDRVPDDAEPCKISVRFNESDTYYIRNSVYDLVIATPSNVRNFNDTDFITDGFIRDEETEKYFKKNFKFKVEIFKKADQCVVVSFKKDITYLHCLISCLPKFLPKYFADKPLTDDELVFLSMFTRTDSEPIRQKIREFIAEEQVDALENLAERLKRQRIKSLNAEVERLNSRINDYTNSIATCIADRRVQMERIAGIMADETDPAKEFRDYVKANNNINLDSVDGTICKFTINSYLHIQDEKVKIIEQKIKNNEHVTIFASYGGMPYDKNITFFREVFVNKKYKLKLSARYFIDLVNYNSGAERFDVNPEDRIPNPHINDYRCMGEYSPMCTDAMNRGDISGMLMIMNVSSGMVNLMEYPSARNMFHWINVYKDKKILVDNDGNEFTPEQIISKAQEEEVNE